MILIPGRYMLAESPHDSQTSSGSDDVGTLEPTADATAMTFSVESPPIRASFDGRPPSAEHGIQFGPGTHFLPFAERMQFISTEEGRQVRVSVLWLAERNGGTTTASA